MAFLRSWGAALPPDVVTNEMLGARTGKDAATIEKNTGMRERRYAAEGVSVVDLGLAAAQNCLESVGMTAAEVGLVLFSCGSVERCFPGPASALAARLGMTSTPAIDLPIASAGSLVGIALASDLAARYGNVLVVAAEIMSRRVSHEDPDTAILFGDGAGACLVSRDSGFARIVDAAIHTDGNYAESLTLPLAGPLQMKGLEVILQASRKIPRAITDVLAKHGMVPENVGVFLMHQANLNLIRRVAAALKVPEERFFVNIDEYGNTSSASLLIAGQAQWRQGYGGKPIVLAAFGAGFSWGAVLAVPVEATT
jgi:3-oxoacyl-[acyl-carrier-protein] synthase-3